MKKAVMKKWVAALRSGKYKRGTKYLKQESNGVVKHCCLGVLCELAKVEWTANDSFLNEKVYEEKEHGKYSALPDSVEEWSGVGDGIGRFEYAPGRYTSLASMNDSGKYSFAKIADIIEKNWEKL